MSGPSVESGRLATINALGRRCVRTKMALCARRSRLVRTKMVREITGVRTKTTKIWGAMRVAFVRTNLTWLFG